MAWHIKTNNIPGKIIILDPKPNIAPIGEGYRAAFEELYPDIITHVPNAVVREVDPFKNILKPPRAISILMMPCSCLRIRQQIWSGMLI